MPNCHRISPPVSEEVKNVCLIRQEELQNIRNIWLNEKHEFEDSLPKIYYDVTGNVYEDDLIVQNRYYSKEEWDLLKLVCKEEFPDEELMLELQSSLLDITAKESTIPISGRLPSYFFKPSSNASTAPGIVVSLFSNWINLLPMMVPEELEEAASKVALLEIPKPTRRGFCMYWPNR